ncbi:UNVERIFIED_ORG: nitrile hydratase accessory protein [Kosakonia oryzae]|uniref:Nitrile hydratase accessory protein n=1 Tax=Kosakonia radicincitans TaxID=283686 RepID=A0AAX2EKZ4_9ENTR|nr:nitrile hydratase accessory protein [Kosakonia radicincitans]MDP9565302.1 nitrile hydratase accessory protein [Kosakonia oryzae]SFD85671.1 nitrile hydratase accessory protein [Kosakonia radicincitans]SFQ95105.1 nitrile hydratase accessory protein [Kosakonia radicincitans]SFT34551.1 nitrile hydratase accessory protein [Kosakonia radicincitans]SFX00548.1 nitrile hydratase accessory protein [Kosakonia radicincitans]
MSSEIRTNSAPSVEESAPFEHPWQAQVFSLIVYLHQAGQFSWKAWVDVFSTEIKASPLQKGESINDAYYRQWVSAAEKMLLSLELTGKEDITRRTNEWRQAYLNTPHGMPVVLTSATCAPAHNHHHPALRVPVAVSPASARMKP